MILDNEAQKTFLVKFIKEASKVVTIPAEGWKTAADLLTAIENAEIESPVREVKI